MAKANGTRSRRAVTPGPAAREGHATALHRTDLVGPKIELDTQDDGPEHRAFPRAKLAVPFVLWIGEGETRRFSATLTSANVSVSGAFLKSSFFLPVTEVALARLFLGEQLRKFAEGYLGSPRARSLTSELDRVVDALAAWELMKVTSPDDPWRFAK